MAVTFDVSGPCATKGSTIAVESKRINPKTGKRAIVVKTDSKRLRPWTSECRKAAWVHGATAYKGGPVVVRVDVVRRPPLRTAETDAAMTRPDVDKYLRAVLDALAGIVYADDSHVIEATCRKRYGLGREFTRITIDHADTAAFPPLHTVSPIPTAASRKGLTAGEVSRILEK